MPTLSIKDIFVLQHLKSEKYFTVIRLKHRNKLGLRVLKTRTLFTTPIVLWVCKNCEYYATIVIYNAKIALCATCQFRISPPPIGKFVTRVTDALRAQFLSVSTFGEYPGGNWSLTERPSWKS